jgi:transposase-like protein
LKIFRGFLLRGFCRALNCYTRKQYSPGFKARVAVEAIRGEKTLSQLGSQFKVHPIQIAKWRKSAIKQLPDLFIDGAEEGRGG